jgi:hypothetical protein
MEINEISLEELKNNSKQYALEYTTDELLDALNLCKEDEKRKNVIIKILKLQHYFESLMNKEIDNSELNLRIILDKFYANPDAYSVRNLLMKI